MPRNLVHSIVLVTSVLAWTNHTYGMVTKAHSMWPLLNADVYNCVGGSQLEVACAQRAGKKGMLKRKN